MKRPLIVSLAAAALFLILGVQGALALAPGMELVSVSSGGVQGDSGSGRSCVNNDGRYVAFESNSTNLVSPATSGGQIFVRDRFTGATTLASAGPGGVYGDGYSGRPSISGDGRYVDFVSQSTNLTSPPGNGYFQLYVRDTQAGATSLASVNAGGDQGNADSYNPSVSGDGRYVTFQSQATNLVPAANNGFFQIFLRDTQAGTTTLISAAPGGEQGNWPSAWPSISPDGRYVAFESNSSNLVSPPTSGDYSQIYVHDRQTGATWLASKGPGGVEGNRSSNYAQVSADGRYVAFFSYATNLVIPPTGDYQIFVYDRQSDTVTQASVNSSGEPANDMCLNAPGISGDGRYITFQSRATNLVTPPTTFSFQVFLRDRQAGVTTLVALNTSGVQGNGYSAFPAISGNGNYISFNSNSTDLVIPPTSDSQIFISGGPYVPPPVPTFTITSTAGANGSISPSGSVIVNSGASRTFTITANSGYQIADVLVDGVSAGALSSYTFSNVTANHTISASFSASSIGSGDQPRGSGSTGTPISVQPPVQLPNIQVQSASLSASKVTPGTPVTITASVANRGTATGTTAVKVYVNGQEETSAGVTVNSGSNSPVSFTVSRDEPGTYEVYVNGAGAGSFTVENFTPDTILIISGTLVLVALVGGAAWITRRRQTGN